MSVEIKVPALGESVTEATVAKWFKSTGDQVAADEPLVELETDKVTLEVNAPVSGTIDEILAGEGSEVEVGAILGHMSEGEAPAKGDGKAGGEAKAEKAEETKEKEPEKSEAKAGGGKAAPSRSREAGGKGGEKAGPAARKAAEEKGVDLAEVTPTGPKGNVTKGDVQAAEARDVTEAPAAKEAPARQEAPAKEPAAPEPAARAEEAPGGRQREERVRMTRLRRRIAERLKEAQNTAAMLTTFNEVDMSAVMALRKRHQDAFVKKHGLKLGFMSFFVKAAIEALRAYPQVNAEIDGEEIVYKYYYDIGVAVSTESGLVVPVVRGADRMSFAAIEKEIMDLGEKARDGKLAMEDLIGGSFTISNGGIFGSMWSTPILNPPQVGILGMHKVMQRPMVMDDGRIEARPMMYLALSYDHRLVDGREAVQFLVRIKDCIEDPERMLLDA